jgi:hypothetical protein
MEFMGMTTWTESPKGEQMGILHNFCRNHIGIGKIGAVFEALIPER